MAELLEETPEPGSPNLPTRFVMLIGGLMVAIVLSALRPVPPDIEAASACAAFTVVAAFVMISTVSFMSGGERSRKGGVAVKW